MRASRPQVAGLAVITALAVVAGACGGGSSGTKVTSTTAAPATTVTTLGGSPGAGAAAACQEDVRTVQQASDLYEGRHGTKAPSIDALVADGILQQAPSRSAGYVVSYDPRTGHASASGACTVP